MKRFTSLIPFLLLISIIGLIFNNTLIIKAHPKTIYVDDDNFTGPWDGTAQHPYQNITSALAHASPGDTIYVYNGTYYEHLTINKPISLIGQNKNATIIDGNRTGTIIKVTANNVEITGFTIKNSGLFNYKLCGIYIENVINCSISHNIITYNYKGIHIVNSNRSIFTDNTFIKNLEAIYFTNSSNNTFIKNKLSENEFAIVLINSNNNKAFHNNFINNTHTVSSVNSVNFWDNSVEGNYWSDYEGKDINQDGIGDLPYTIATNNVDNYPLMGIYTEFIIIYENKTHHIPIICNSTISNFKFNKTFNMLNFKVIDITNRTGFCRITIPEQLIHKPYIVLVDEQKVNTTALPISNTTHTTLYFTYNLTISPREVKILSKPYYELLEKYNALLENYRKLNSTYYQLLIDYNSLNQTYWQLFMNYTDLQTSYKALNQTYQESLTNYNKLQDKYDSLLENYNTLNQTFWEYFQMKLTIKNLASLNQTYQQILTKYDSLNQTYQELTANYTILRNDYNSLQTSYNNLLEQYNTLNSVHTNTRTALLYVSLTAIAITLITSPLIIRYHRKLKEQKKLAEVYKSELERISILNIAREQFETDVQRRKEKIKKFERKYGITVRPRRTLEEVISSLKLKEEKEVR